MQRLVLSASLTILLPPRQSWEACGSAKRRGNFPRSVDRIN
jgi:hypothetical protein